MGRSKPIVERRKHERIRVNSHAFTINAAKSGRIIDISPDGMTIHYIDRKSWPQEEPELDIVVDDPLFGDTPLRVSRLSFRPVSDGT
ncbi:MAG: PilZ domain-containing protein, partial [Desulfobulbaceae bacterium]|nr:PilZ domain-containing protein [Desulfobulbaceae bacterium]